MTEGSPVEASCWVIADFQQACCRSFGAHVVVGHRLDRALARVFLTIGASSRYSGGRAVVEVVHHMLGMVRAKVSALTVACFRWAASCAPARRHMPDKGPEMVCGPACLRCPVVYAAVLSARSAVVAAGIALQS